MKTSSLLSVLVCAFAVASLQADTAADYAAEFKKTLGDVRTWHVHTGHAELRRRIASAEAFIAKYAADATKANDVADIRTSLVRTYVRDRDAVGAKAHARALTDARRFDTRLLAVTTLADALLEEKRDFAGALALFEPLYATEGLRPAEYASLVSAGANVLVTELKRDAALAYVEKARKRYLGKLDENGRVALDRALDGVAAGVYDKFYQPREAVAYLMKRGNEAAAFAYYANANLGATDVEWETGTALAKNLVEKEGDLSAWAFLCRRDIGFCEATLDRVAGEGKARKVGPVMDRLNKILARGYDTNVFGAPHTARTKNYGDTVRLYRLYARLAEEAKKPVPFDVVQYAVFALTATGDRAAARAEIAKALAAGEKLKPEETYQLKVMDLILATAGDENAVFAALEKGEGALAAAHPEKGRKTSFAHAASVASASGDVALMRGAARYYKTVVNPTLERKSYTVRFSKRLVAGAGDWVNLPFTPDESDFDRQYGGSGLAFMTTDVATGDRGNAVEGGEKVRQHPTTLQAVADEWGVHILFTFYDRRARQFESGELDCGSYECYIAPGENQPYACFMTSPKADSQATVMNTTYQTFGHRRIDPKNPASMKSETFYTDNAILSYVAFSWNNFPEHVPAFGGEWDFESIFWGPVKSAWNGTETIHGRSTWGKLRFELDDAARVAILRAQLFKAVNGYKAEKSPRGSRASGLQEGCFDHWADDGVGDPAFYEAKLAPLVAELDAVAEKVKVGMADADVKDICEKYLSKFINIRQIVAQLRSAWVVDCLSTDNN